MSESKVEKLIIIGSGPAACTAAIYASRASLDPLMIIGYEEGGQLTTTPEVGNWPGSQGDPSGYDLMHSMVEHAKALGTRSVRDTVEKVDFSGDVKKLTLTNGDVLQAHSVIIATGARARYLGLAHEQELKGKGVSACATCDGFFFRNKTVAVVGGGSVAFIEALFLAKLCKKVYIIHRREGFRAEQILVDRVADLEKQGKIELILNAKITAYKGSDFVEGLALDVKGEARDLALDGVFVAIGHQPATDIFKGQINLDDKGYIITNNSTVPVTATSCEGVFAAGDCAFPEYHQAIVAAGTGCKAALDAEKYLISKSL